MSLTEHECLGNVNPTTSSTPIYVVGPATAKSVTSLGFPPECIHGANCGNGEVLSKFMLDDYKSSLKLLFLVGEVRRDIIPKTLASAGIGVDELVVYETQVMKTFPDDLKRVTEKELPEGESRWIVIFSPTGSDAAMQVIGRGGDNKSPGSGSSRTFIATIGPTTASHLRTLNVEPNVIAQSPSPVGLWEGIERFFENSER